MSKLGISSVTMDMIASHCGISKRTLYEHFADKQTLVNEVIAFMYNERTNKSKEVIDHAPNKLEAILQIYFSSREYAMLISEVFINDLTRLYPEIQQNCQTRESFYANQLSELLRKGAEEGMFRKAKNYSNYAILLNMLMRQIKPNMGSFSEGTAVISMLDIAFFTFIRGLASAKGLEIIDKALAEQNIEL